MKKYKHSLITILLIFLFSPLLVSVQNINFSVSYSSELSQKPQDGRILLLISNNSRTEPRNLVGEYNFLSTQLVFGKNVEKITPDQNVIFNKTVFGFPLKSISEIPPGEYFVQAVFHLYETFHRSDGHTVKLPMDRGEGQRWDQAPGNYFSKPIKIKIHPVNNQIIKIKMDKKNPPIPARSDTKYIKHIRIQSELLSHFWGRPMHLGAVILLPEGFMEHPKVKYPLVIKHDHFSPTITNFRETPPPSGVTGGRKRFYERSHAFYKKWVSKDFPRVLLAKIIHPTPYYDDSYGVNSANNGPYGDAILKELIPYIEKKFRGIGQGWARTMYGGSTGGWTSLAVQIFYPDDFNGCWAACPDTVDFRSHILVNLYIHKNMYYRQGPWIRYKIPGGRDGQGNVISTNEAQNHRELAFATKSRSGFQWDVWDSVFSPVGKDGYPQRVFDKLTGEINPSIAEYWRENYDLSNILERDWGKIGKKLVGKIHIYTGDMDTFYLNNPVVLLENFLESTKNPYYSGSIKYGDRFGHCWTGHPSSLKSKDRCPSDAVFYIPLMANHIVNSAPEGADIKSWFY